MHNACLQLKSHNLKSLLILIKKSWTYFALNFLFSFATYLLHKFLIEVWIKISYTNTFQYLFRHLFTQLLLTLL